MSYFEYFYDNIFKNKDPESIVGCCQEMCPEEEKEMREKANMVHVLEVWGPIVRKLVKSFSRSAADNNNMANPRLLRPVAVLKTTLVHLLLDVSKRTDVSTACVYDFVNDRLRAMRQDMTIQRLPAEDCITLLEPMVRFYVFYGYKLRNSPLKDFDPVLNKKYLLECLKWFLTCTKDDNMGDLTGMLSKMNINNKLKSDRILMEALYILCNLDDLNPLYRYLTLPQHLKKNPKLQLAYRIAILNLRGNYIQVCRLMDQLCPLTYCALCTYLPTLQRRGLQVMSNAYNSKTLTVPATVLCEWLRFGSAETALAACKHYGLSTEGNVVRFSKAQFLHDAPLFYSETKDVSAKNFSVDNIFTYV